MRYRAEIFDMVQYLFEKTGFNDHQLHVVIRFKGNVDAAAMEKAFRLLIQTVPVLSRAYRSDGGKSYWEDTGASDFRELFTVVDNAGEFDRFTCSRTIAETGPQFKGCLLQAENDALSIVANHMLTDGAGMKECVYLLSQIYTKITMNPFYAPDFVIDGDRRSKRILEGIPFKDRLRVLLFRSGDNNTSGVVSYPLPGGSETEPFIATKELTPEKYHRIVDFSKQHDATVNDVIFTAYLRVLAAVLGLQGEKLCVPMMVDMRRYREDKSFDALANFASMELLKVSIHPDEDFSETLSKVSAISKAKKDDFLGLNSFVKLQTLFMLAGRGRAYHLLERHLKNPNICITNIGILDDKRLVFDGLDIETAYITGSIKYRPHFQMSFCSYRDRMTLAVNLYGSKEDRAAVDDFFATMDRELDAVLVSQVDEITNVWPRPVRDAGTTHAPRSFRLSSAI